MTELTKRMNLKAAVAGAAVVTLASALVPKNAQAFIFPGVGNSLDNFNENSSLSFKLDTDSNTIGNFDLSYFSDSGGDSLNISFPSGNLTSQNCCSFDFSRFDVDLPLASGLDAESDFKQYSVSFSNGTTDLIGFESESISGIFNFIFPTSASLEQASEVGNLLGFVQFEGDFATALNNFTIDEESPASGGITNNLSFSGSTELNV